MNVFVGEGLQRTFSWWTDINCEAVVNAEGGQSVNPEKGRYGRDSCVRQTSKYSCLHERICWFAGHSVPLFMRNPSASSVRRCFAATDCLWYKGPLWNTSHKRLHASMNVCKSYFTCPAYFFIFGSNASLRPSPNRLNDRMIRLIRSAGKITRYG